MRIACSLVLFISLACGSSDSDTPSLPDSGSQTDAAAPVGEVTSIALPQATAGALWANPVVYPTIPVHVAVGGTPSTVRVEVEGTFVDAVASDGEWIAQIPIAVLGAGAYTLEATAQGQTTSVSVSAELHLGVQGIQLTEFSADGAAASPRLHRIGDDLVLTWADRSEGRRTPWLQHIDGAGRLVGERVRLVSENDEIHYSRTVFGKSSIAVLYQISGGPYANFLAIVDADGTELMAPLALDDPSRFGSFGGDIAYDGEAFIVTWRENDGAGRGVVRWLRVDETSLERTGPVEVARSGIDDPHGGFSPFTFLGIDAVGDGSLVSFVRERWDDALDIGVPKAQLAYVDRDGVVLSEFAGIESDFTWHDEARVFRFGDTAVALWTSKSLLSPENNIPVEFYATRTDEFGKLDPNRGAGHQVLFAPGGRSEPFAIDHPTLGGVLAWTDERSYELDILSGRIELYVGALDEELTMVEPVVVPHARFIAGTSQLNGASAGTNVVLVWLDERNGNGIVDPRPEVFLETAWY